MVTSTRIGKYILAAALLTLVAGCGLQQVQPKTNGQPTVAAPTPSPVPTPTIAILPKGASSAAIVNGVSVPMAKFSDLLRYIVLASSQQGQALTASEAARQTIVELIENVIISRKAAARHITVPASTVNKQVNAFVKNAGGAAGLKRQGLTKADLRYVVGPGLLSQQVAKAEFPLQKSGPVVTARHILITFKQPQASPVMKLFQPPAVTKDKCTGKVLSESTAHAEAQSLLNKINKGTSFATLAKKCSDDTSSAVQGGSIIGDVSSANLYPSANEFLPSFDNALASLPVGTPSLVSAQDGWHILEVQTRKHEKFSTTIADTIQQSEFQSWIVKLAEHSNTHIIEQVK